MPALALFLAAGALCVLASCAPGSPYPDLATTTSETTIDGLTYRLHVDATASLAHADGASTGQELSIPATIEADGQTYTVTLLESACLANCPMLRSVAFPDTIRETRSALFADSPVVEVDMGEGIEKIDGSFDGADELVSIDLPTTLKTIGERSFRNCSSLSSVRLPESLVTLGSYSFAGCTNLKSMSLPASLETIGVYAFQNSGLESIEIADGVRQLAAHMLQGTRVRELHVPGSVSSLPALFESEFVFESSNDTLVKAVLDEGVGFLDSNCFAGCKSLSEVSLPSTLSSIGERSFYGTANLSGLTIPPSVSDVGVGAFQNSALRSIDFPQCSVPDQAFEGSTQLERVVLPYGVDYIGKRAFYGCSALRSCELPFSVNTVASKAFLTDGEIRVTIPNGWIEDDAFDSETARLVVGHKTDAEYYALTHGIPFDLDEELEQI